MLICLTANHRNTDFGALERLATVDADAVLGRLRPVPAVAGAVVLATCNRFELYLDLDQDDPTSADLARREAIVALSDGFGEHAEVLDAGAVTLVGDAAVRHLFAVSAGLESMVVGEDEISGQVQRALVSARAAGTTSRELELAFQRAAHATRAVRSESDPGAAGRSIARLALDLASSRVTDWAATGVLIVGTGSYAATTIAALRARGADDIRVFSATGRAARFAVRYGVSAEPDLRAALAHADVVITCTSRYTISVEDMRDSPARLVVDLGLPRNVDPAVGTIDGVELLDLELIGLHAEPMGSRTRAHELVVSAAEEFAADRAAAPAVVAVRQHIQSVLDSELRRLRDRGGDDRAEAALRHLAGVLSHDMSVRARRHAAEGRLREFEAAVETMFGTAVEPPSAAQGEQLTG